MIGSNTPLFPGKCTLLNQVVLKWLHRFRALTWSAYQWRVIILSLICKARRHEYMSVSFRGSYMPDCRELDSDAVAASKIVVDTDDAWQRYLTALILFFHCLQRRFAYCKRRRQNQWAACFRLTWATFFWSSSCRLSGWFRSLQRAFLCPFSAFISQECAKCSKLRWRHHFF